MSNVRHINCIHRKKKKIVFCNVIPSRDKDRVTSPKLPQTLFPLIPSLFSVLMFFFEISVSESPAANEGEGRGESHNATTNHETLRLMGERQRRIGNQINERQFTTTKQEPRLH